MFFFRYSVLFSRNEFLKTCSPSLLFIDNGHASDWLYKGNMVYTRTPTRSLQYIHISTHTHDVQLHGRTWKSSLYMRMTLQWPFSRRPQTAGHLRPKAWMGMSVPTALRRMRAIFKNLYREICKPGPCVAIQWFHAKCVIGFSLFSRDPDGWSISNFYRFVSLCIWWLTLSAYTASNCFVSKNQTCIRPLSMTWYHCRVVAVYIFSGYLRN